MRGESCPYCSSSIGEKEIRKILDLHNISYIEQYRITECRYKKPLPFDFAIFDKHDNLMFLLEYQGRQHYTPSQFGNISLDKAKQNLEECQMRDKIKADYCTNNNINLLVIKYSEHDNLENILISSLKEFALIQEVA